jgi:hypothetical protein
MEEDCTLEKAAKEAKEEEAKFMEVDVFLEDDVRFNQFDPTKNTGFRGHSIKVTTLILIFFFYLVPQCFPCLLRYRLASSGDIQICNRASNEN